MTSNSSKRRYSPYKRYCCAYGCLNKKKNKESELSFFTIPDDIDRRQEWLTVIGRKDLLDEKKLNQAKKNFICSVHFDDSAIITSIAKRLKSDAVPTKLLPHMSDKIQADARDVIITTKNTSAQALPQITKDLSSHLSKKDYTLVSTYSHTQSQTDIQPQKHTLPHEKEREISKPNTDKSLNELKDKSSVVSEPTTSTSQSQTKYINCGPCCSKIIKTESLDAPTTSSAGDVSTLKVEDKSDSDEDPLQIIDSSGLEGAIDTPTVLFLKKKLRENEEKLREKDEEFKKTLKEKDEKIESLQKINKRLNEKINNLKQLLVKMKSKILVLKRKEKVDFKNKDLKPSEDS